MPPKAAEKQVSEETQEKKSNLENVKYQCTACEEYIKTSFDAYVHPLLKCLICRKCHTEYKTGDFAEDFTDGVDSEGIDNYCRWCVDGGDLFACCNQDRQTDQCTHVFCDKCISRNVPDDPVMQADAQPEGFKWLCYVCNPAPLKELRKHASEAILLLSQRDLKRQKESVPASSQGQTPAQRGDDRAVTSNGSVAPSRKGSEPTSPSKSQAAASKDDDKVAPSKKDDKVPPTKKDDDKVTPSKKDDDKVAPSKKDDKVAPTKRDDDKVATSKKDDKVATNSSSGSKNLDESVSERKRRRTEAATSSSSTPVASEPERRESLTRKEKDKKKDEEAARDPESLRLPPLEKPKQPQTSLRNLSRTSIQPGFRLQTAPPSTVPTTPQSSSASRQSLIPSSGNSITRSAKVGFVINGPSVTGKGLKLNNDQSEHASTKVKLGEQELKKRLGNFSSIKNKCIGEIDSKVQSICEMFTNPKPEHKNIIKREIDDLKVPLQEFQTLLVNIESLYSSQS